MKRTMKAIKFGRMYRYDWLWLRHDARYVSRQRAWLSPSTVRAYMRAMDGCWARLGSRGAGP